MNLTTLSLPRYNQLLGLYEFDITNNNGTETIYADSIEKINEKKKRYIEDNLRQAQEEINKL